MKQKTALWLALLLCLSAALAAAEETDTCLAFAQWYPELAKEAGVQGADAQRLVVVDIMGQGLYYLLLPEDSGIRARDCHYAGLRLTFDKPFAIEREENRVLSVTMPTGILHPSKAEVVGTVTYGEVKEIGTDYIIQEIWYDADHQEGIEAAHGTQRFTLLPDAILQYGIPFAPGGGCSILSDEHNTVLLMAQGNG